jgi:hypothetical protein
MHLSAAARAQQSRLILQDPRAWEEAQIPLLRLSRELGSSSDAGLDRATAQQTWQALQLKPEEVISQSVQFREALAKTQTAVKLADTARAEVVQLQGNLAQMHAERWQYAAASGISVALVGAAWYWLSERKKRLKALESTTRSLENAHEVLVFPEPVPVVGQAAQASEFQAVQGSFNKDLPDPVIDSLLHESRSSYSEPTNAVTPHFDTPAPWWKRFSQHRRNVVPPTTQLETLAVYSSTLSPNLHTQIDPYEGTTELEDMQMQDGAGYDPEQANLELLSQTRIQPASSEDAMDHLLELRMAVQALCALEQPDTAKKLLQEHIEAVPDTSAWAYMEYLALCTQLELKDEFELMRTSYRLHFNRLAPEWQEPHAFEQTLEVYERPMAELCSVWSSPEQTRELIATWLLGALSLRRAFQLPAQHDLLDLYEMLEFYGEDQWEMQDFVSTVSLLDLDYEFAVDVTIEPQSAADALRAVPTVKTGNFDVDFNLTQGATESSSSTFISDVTEIKKII